MFCYDVELFIKNNFLYFFIGCVFFNLIKWIFIVFFFIDNLLILFVFRGYFFFCVERK